jgi:PAS domain-containing protein
VRLTLNGVPEPDVSKTRRMHDRARPEGPTKRALVHAGAGICLLVTVAAGYATRISLADSNAWLRQTREVRLALASAELSLERAASAPANALPSKLRDLDEVRTSVRRVGDLTGESRRHQASVERALTLLDALTREPHQPTGPEEAASADTHPGRSVLEEMVTGEEARDAQRQDDLDSVRRRSSLIFAIAGGLSIALWTLALVGSRGQRRALAQVRAEIHRNGAMLASIVENVSEGVMAMTTDNELLVVNEAARSMVGARFPLNSLGDWRAHLKLRV